MAGWAFGALGAPQLCAVCLPDNDDSAKLMRRLGMRYRGLEDWYGRPHAVYAIARSEWIDSGGNPSGAAPPAPAARPD